MDQQSAASAPTGCSNYRQLSRGRTCIECVHSLRPERDSIPEPRVMVADGGSGDGSAEKLRAELAEMVD